MSRLWTKKPAKQARKPRGGRKSKKYNDDDDAWYNDDDGWYDEATATTATTGPDFTLLNNGALNASARCPPGAHAPSAANIVDGDNESAFGCKPFHRPVPNLKTGKICCVPIPPEERAEVAEIFSGLIDDLVVDYGADALQVPGIGHVVLLDAYRLAFPSDYRNFTFQRDPRTGMLTVTATGRTAGRLMRGRGGGGRGYDDREQQCGQYGVPSAKGPGIGGCARFQGLDRDDVAPVYDAKTGATCCQRLSTADQHMIQKNLIKAADELARFVDDDADATHWYAHTRANPYLDSLISALAQWTLSTPRRQRR